MDKNSSKDIFTTVQPQFENSDLGKTVTPNEKFIGRTKIRKRLSFITTDGTSHSNFEDALKHQSDLNVINIITDVMKDHGYRDMTAHDACRVIEEHADRIVSELRADFKSKEEV